MHYVRSARGLTVVEVLVAVAVLALLLVLGVAGYSALTSRAIAERGREYIEALASQTENYVTVARRMGVPLATALNQAYGPQTPFSGGSYQIPGGRTVVVGTPSSPLPGGFVGYYSCRSGGNFALVNSVRTGLQRVNPPRGLVECQVVPFVDSRPPSSTWGSPALGLIYRAELRDRTAGPGGVRVFVKETRAP